VIPRNLAVILLAAVTIVVTSAPDVIAHGVHAPMKPADGATFVPPQDATWWDVVYGRIGHEMGALLKMARDGGVGPWVAVLMLAFGYGVVHAVGPGHGKLLLASYMTATRAPVILGVAIALAAAAIQAAIAIAVVLIVAVGLEGVATAGPALQNSVHAVSLMLLAALGLAIVLRQLAAFNWLPQPIARVAPVATCACCSHEDHAHGHAPHHHAGHHEHNHHRDHGHEHRHAHVHDDGHDNHGHGAAGDPVATLGIMGTAVSMGARPCTSAFAILLLALANNLLLLGIAATIAMAFGVACTLVLVAVLSVDLRKHAAAVLQRTWLPQNAVGMVSLIAGTLLTTVALAGLVQAATG